MFVHLTSNIISCRSVIAGVKLCEPFSVDILGNTTAHLIGVGPDHSRIMTYIGTEPEGFDTFLAKELHFIIPVRDGALPIGGRALPTLFIDVQILAHFESRNFSA